MLSAVAARKAALAASPDDSDSPSDNSLDSLSSPLLDLNPKQTTEPDNLISTFKPAENIIALSSDESRSLGLSGTATLVVFNLEETLCLLGTCNLVVLHGSFNLCGVTLPASSTIYPIFAPRSSPLPIIQADSGKEKRIFFDENTLPSRLRPFFHFPALIALQELNTNIEGLGHICRTFQGVFEPSRWQKSSTMSPFNIRGLHMVSHQNKESIPFILPPSWASALDAVSNTANNLAYLVKGPRNSGKSTFARTLMNRLLGLYRCVAFLECDLGQSEFTPGGMVALNVISSPVFGPPFTHPTLPNYAHYVGSTTPRSSPSTYIDSIRALIQTYRLDIQTPSMDMMDDETDTRISDTIPIIVNTMGWTKGLGADLNEKIEVMLDPTDIFSIQSQSPGDASSYPSSFQAQNVYKVYRDPAMMDTTTARMHILEPIPPAISSPGYTAADHRSISLLSYFYSQFSLDGPQVELSQITAKFWDTSRPLCAIAPYKVDCSAALDSVILTGPGTEDVVAEEINRVLNASIIGLVRCEPGTLTIEGPSNAGIPYSQGSTVPLPESSTCIGLALIRALSPPPTSSQESKTFLHILTPLPKSLLSAARVAVKGEMELPIWGFLDFRNFADESQTGHGDVGGMEKDKVPYLQWGKAEGAIGAEKRRVRRNIMRKGQM